MNDPGETRMDFAAEFERKFSSRKSRWLVNLEALHEFIDPPVLYPASTLPGLVGKLNSDEPTDALRLSILYLWSEAVDCFVLGQYQASILASGSVVERILKLEYQKAKGPLPQGKWSLGKCVYHLDFSGTRIETELLDHAGNCIDPKNDRAHALLEHSDPAGAFMGGDRAIDLVSDTAYLIEPYWGDARGIAQETWTLLKSLYSKGKESG